MCRSRFKTNRQTDNEDTHIKLGLQSIRQMHEMEDVDRQTQMSVKENIFLPSYGMAKNVFLRLSVTLMHNCY